MKRSLTIFLQIIIVNIGISALALMLWEPHIEGRNVNATLFQIYFNDPFLAYAYFASIAFFIGLYQAFKLLRYVRRNKTFSQYSLKALRIIKYCALSLIGFLVGAEAYFFIVMRGKDDIAGGVAVGLFLILVSGVVTIVADVLGRRIKIDKI